MLMKIIPEGTTARHKTILKKKLKLGFVKSIEFPIICSFRNLFSLESLQEDQAWLHCFKI